MGATRYSVHIAYVRPDFSTGGMITSGSNLAEAMAKAFTEGTYYLAQGYRVRAEIEEVCHGCGGYGKVRDTRSKAYQTKRCKDCGGREGPVASWSVPIVAHENVKVVDAREPDAVEPLNCGGEHCTRTETASSHGDDCPRFAQTLGYLAAGL